MDFMSEKGRQEFFCAEGACGQKKSVFLYCVISAARGRFFGSTNFGG